MITKSKASSTPEAIGDVLSPLMARLTTAKRPSSDEVGRVWRTLVGAKAARHSRPTSLRQGELLIAVDASAWLWNLTLQRPRLLTGLQAALGPEQVTTIRLRIHPA